MQGLHLEQRQSCRYTVGSLPHDHGKGSAGLELRLEFVMHRPGCFEQIFQHIRIKSVELGVRGGRLLINSMLS